ncbi:MAG: hypothetical protein KC643_11105 [Nitrospira sp.]|nr:hypothetical protein [Nitrospira sp.]MCA9465975.1 hypothetical protein [Nitrospira sp.]
MQTEYSTQKEPYTEPLLTTHEALRDFTTGTGSKASLEVPKILVEKQ